MHAVHARLGNKAAEQLAAITKSDLRSVKRHFARGGTKRLPNGPALASMLVHPVVGIALIVELTRTLSPAERQEFWNEMVGAAGDALRKNR